MPSNERKLEAEVTERSRKEIAAGGKVTWDILLLILLREASMNHNRGLRTLAYAFKIVSLLALVTTILIVLAIVSGGTNAPPGVAGFAVWAVSLGGGVLAGLVGLTAALLLFALGEVISLVLALKGHLQRILSSIGDRG